MAKIAIIAGKIRCSTAFRKCSRRHTCTHFDSASAHALKLVTRNILQLTGVKSVRAILYGLIEAAGETKRKQWLRDIEAFGREAGYARISENSGCRCM